MRLLIATNNQDKLREIAHILRDCDIQIYSMRDIPAMAEVVEDRDTIRGNAAKKALETARHSGMICLADDTGLFIDALDGAPGVYAARWAGEDCSYADNRHKALEMMQGITQREASFRTCMALAAPDGVIAIKEAGVSGIITDCERGNNGFGYDAVFEPSGTGLTFAEMDDADKNRISHRALALQAILPVIRNLARIH